MKTKTAKHRFPLLLVPCALLAGLLSLTPRAAAQNWYASNGSGLRDPNKPWSARPGDENQLLFNAVIWTGSTGDLLSPEAWSNGEVPNDPAGARTLGSTYTGTMPADFVPGTVLVLPYKATDGTWVIPNTLVTEDPVSVFKPYGGGGSALVALSMAHTTVGDRTLKVDQIQYTDNYTLALSGNSQGRFTLDLAGQGFVRWQIPMVTENTGILGLPSVRPIQVHVGEYATLKYSTPYTTTDNFGVPGWNNSNTWLFLDDATAVLDLSESWLGFGFARIDGVAGSKILMLERLATGAGLTIGGVENSHLDSNISQAGTGMAGLSKTGDGELYLGGINTYRGNTTLSAGALFINGEVAGSVAASNNTFLGGDALASGVEWNVRGSVTVAATTTTFVSAGAAGGRVGEFRVQGNYSQMGNVSWIIVDLAGDGAGGILHDKIVVGGVASLGCSLSVRPLPGLALHAGRYTIIEAGSRTGEFFSVVMPGFLSIDCAVEYGPRNVDVVFSQRRFTGIAGLDPNSLAVAAVVDNIVDRLDINATDNEIRLLGTLNAVTGLSTMNHALAQITPLADRWWFPTAAAIAGDIEKRLAERAPAILDEGSGRFAIFAGLSMLNSDLPMEGLAESIFIETTRFMGGVDFHVNPALTLTAFYSNETTKADTDRWGGKGRLKGDTFGAHADWRPGDWRFQATAHIGTDDYQSNRSIMLTGLGADYTDSRATGDRLGAALTASRAFMGVLGGSLLPYAGLQWLSWQTDAYTEQKAARAGALPLSVAAQSAASVLARAGLRFEHAYTVKKYDMRVRTFASAGWQWELDDSSRTISATCDRVDYAVTVQGKESGFALRAGAEIDTRGFTISLGAGRENGVHSYDNVSYHLTLARRF
jgi:autotransporter-associated beta strand protein